MNRGCQRNSIARCLGLLYNRARTMAHPERFYSSIKISLSYPRWQNDTERKQEFRSFNKMVENWWSALSPRSFPAPWCRSTDGNQRSPRSRSTFSLTIRGLKLKTRLMGAGLQNWNNLSWCPLSQESAVVGSKRQCHRVVRAWQYPTLNSPHYMSNSLW